MEIEVKKGGVERHHLFTFSEVSTTLYSIYSLTQNTMLREQITKDLLDGMKAKQDVKVGALRMLKAAIMKLEVSGDGKKEASDEDVLTLVNKEIKSRRDSIEAFNKGGREDLAVKEEEEMKYLMAYMPAQLTEDEIRAIAKEAIANTGATAKGDFGKVMGAMMPKVKGKADGQVVSKIVGELLA